MKRVLLIGGGGFIGKNLQAVLVKSGNFVLMHCLGRNPEVLDEYKIPLRDICNIEKIICEKKIDVVIHLASGLLPSGGFSEFEKEVEEVIRPTFQLVNFCAENGVVFVFFSSGGTVYGDTENINIPENHALAPKSYYGYGKVLLEKYIELCHGSMGLNYIIVRPSNPYGSNQSAHGKQGFIAVALGRVLSGKPVEIWGDGTVVRDYLDVRDLSHAVVELLDGGHYNRTFNIGSSIGYSLNDVVAIIQEVTGRPAQVLKCPSRDFDVKSIVLDTTLLASVIAWQPRNLLVGVREFMQILGDK
ncbi:NAD-dependent epimerase/dehydratase family protein [Pseudomonas sp. N040]|uniref:NAD-dependent epimerase/dehydratase family protein n=1 Tax=Pseudomonas sp. N040 TaxID=2785325 RepID=UPI0018A2F7BB|nr:NAD-dependent epimerase/dehydratase family protein [Pseudomonas sp. N040]MBF7730534.1 NAD-dependent epimerase/dehydratase family protein [Pseudomonas sp. N040]MBW7014178.1 NAD-dependent epimerase/dehydratase family protein [Pseudomonas sp. N040]